MTNEERLDRIRDILGMPTVAWHNDVVRCEAAWRKAASDRLDQIIALEQQRDEAVRLLREAAYSVKYEVEECAAHDRIRPDLTRRLEQIDAFLAKIDKETKP